VGEREIREGDQRGVLQSAMIGGTERDKESMRTRKGEEREETSRTMGVEVFSLHTRREEEMYHHEKGREDRSK
jgi:hypothetical protein